MSVPELNEPVMRPASSRTTVFRHSMSRSTPDRVTMGFSCIGSSPPIRSRNLPLTASQIRAGTQVSIQSRPSNSSAVHPSVEQA